MLAASGCHGGAHQGGPASSPAAALCSQRELPGGPASAAQCPGARGAAAEAGRSSSGSDEASVLARAAAGMPRAARAAGSSSNIRAPLTAGRHSRSGGSASALAACCVHRVCLVPFRSRQPSPRLREGGEGSKGDDRARQRGGRRHAQRAQPAAPLPLPLRALTAGPACPPPAVSHDRCPPPQSPAADPRRCPTCCKQAEGGRAGQGRTGGAGWRVNSRRGLRGTAGAASCWDSEASRGAASTAAPSSSRQRT